MSTQTSLKRRCWKTRRAGSLERLRLVEEGRPPLEAGAVCVRVSAIGLNFADVFACLGLYSATPSGEFIPGLEFAGSIETVGEHVSSFEAGDKVMGVCRFGAYTTHLVTDPARLLPLPEGWSPEQGAAFPVQTLTAWYALHDQGAVRNGMTLLVHSAAGGVGLRALKLLEPLETRVVATVGSADKVRFLEENSALDHGAILVRDRKRFGGQLDEALEHVDRPGFDLILDSVAGPFFHPGFERLNQGGRLVLFGAADLMPRGNRPNYFRLLSRYARRPRIDPLQMISDNRSVLAFNLIWLWDRLDLLVHGFGRLRESMGAPPFVGRVFRFEEAVTALKFLQSGRSVGKVVLTVD